MIIKTILILIFVYLLGSISGSIIISKNFFREDIRLKGSGNAGTTNAFRAYGVKYAALAMSIDFIKTILAMLIADKVGLAVGASEFTKYISGVVVVIGHIWPIYYNFKGGKGVATTGGGMGFLYPNMFLVGCAIFFGISAITGYVSLGSISLMIYLLYLFIFVLKLTGFELLFACLTVVLVIFKHRENIKRLINKRERSIYKGRK